MALHTMASSSGGISGRMLEGGGVVDDLVGRLALLLPRRAGGR
jgi:hypothetical protein